MKEKDRASQQFFIGIIANGQFKDLALAVLPKLEDRLNAEIDLREYTDKVEKVLFTPILDFGEEPIEEKHYDEEKKKLSLKKSIPVVGLGELNEEQFEELVSSTLAELVEGSNMAPVDLINRLKKVLGLPDERHC